MQIKTVRRYYFTPTGMALIKKTDNSKCWRECGKIGALIRCWWESTMARPLQKTVWQFLKMLNSNSTPKQILKEMKTCGHTKTSRQLCSWPPKPETTQTPIHRWMGKQNVVYPYNGIFRRLKKKQSTDIRNSMDKSQKHRMKWTKPDTKGYVRIKLHISIGREYIYIYTEYIRTYTCMEYTYNSLLQN